MKTSRNPRVYPEQKLAELPIEDQEAVATMWQNRHIYMRYVNSNAKYQAEIHNNSPFLISVLS